MYIIKLLGKRFNNKKFASYDEARNYVRRLLTQRRGKYSDSITDAGFSISAR